MERVCTVIDTLQSSLDLSIASSWPNLMISFDRAELKTPVWCHCGSRLFQLENSCRHNVFFKLRSAIISQTAYRIFWPASAEWTGTLFKGVAVSVTRLLGVMSHLRRSALLVAREAWELPPWPATGPPFRELTPEFVWFLPLAKTPCRVAVNDGILLCRSFTAWKAWWI